MRILGVTGGIGSGKSTVCAMLADRGAAVFYADDTAKELQVSDPAVRDAILEAFGEGSYDSDGALNRSYLAGRIFSSEEDRRTINSIVHPAVGSAFQRVVAVSRKNGVRLLVKEAALLFETDTSDLDEILVVDCPQEERIKRVLESGKWAREEVLARVMSQMAPTEMIQRADRVLFNMGSLHDLEEDVDRLYHDLID